MSTVDTNFKSMPVTNFIPSYKLQCQKENSICAGVTAYIHFPQNVHKSENQSDHENWIIVHIKGQTYFNVSSYGWIVLEFC